MQNDPNIITHSDKRLSFLGACIVVIEVTGGQVSRDKLSGSTTGNGR